ncbi:hypothetical protein QTP88_009429 [Uroleucon formosanum]
MIKQTTLQNILTWVIAVVLFIFQSLNYFITRIKKYVIHGQKTTIVVTADTTISSESNLKNSNVPENVITAQGLIQKHFDIPLIIAEDEPKVYSFIKNAKLLTSNEICKEKTKIDQFMENLVDDSYVARGLGLITATVGRQSEFYLYSKYDKNFENIVIRLNGRNGEIGQITILSKNHENIVKPKSIPMNYFYDKDRIKVTYTPFAEGVYTLTLEQNSLSICRSPYYISVEKSPTNSRSQIRLGTKKYKPVTKFSKSKNSSLDTYDNSIPVIEPNKPSTCKTILPESEKNSIRTDVMSIVTKFESNSINFQNKVHKSTSNISEKELETNLVDDIPKYPNIPPKIETDKIYDTYFSDLNSPSIHSKTISTDNNFWNDVDITYKNSKASDINTINFKSELTKKPTTKLNKCTGIAKDIPEVKNVSSTHLQSTNMVLVESLKIGNSRDVEKDNQTFKTIELMEENKHIGKHLDFNARINETEIKCIDDKPCIQNEVSCFDDKDRKTVVVTKNNNEIESNLNDTVIQQITDSAQYNINTPFTSIITKITNSICEKCSIEVLKIISEFPRDINIAHKNNSNEMRSSFETLLAQPINININIDNMFEHPIIATNERNNENVLNISPTKIKRIDKIDKDIKCSYINEIEPIDNNSDERCDKQCDDINNMSKELLIKQKKDNGKIDKTLKDEIFHHCIVPFAEHTIDKHNTGRQNNELSKNEIMKIKYSTTNEENVLHSNQFYNNTIHKSDSKMEIQIQHLEKSSEHSIHLIKTNQFHENINEELNLLSKESDKPLETSNLITINNDKNTNYELVKDEFEINNVIIPDENTNIQCSVINDIVLATSEYKSEDNEEQTNNISYKNVTLTSIQNDNQKLMIEKSIEPVLTSFKNTMVEKITQLYLNMNLSNTDNSSTFETYDKHLTNDLPEIQINNNANSTEINPKCIETVTSQLKNHIDKNEISVILLDQQKTDDNHLFKYVENIIKTKINPSGLYEKTLGKKKLQTLVNTAMNYQNDQQIENEFKRMIIDNEIQDEELKEINDNEIVQDIEAKLVETPNVKIIKNSDELILSKNEVTVKRQCKIPLINDFDSIKVEKTNIDSKQEMQTINVNENDTIVDTNAEEIKALQNFKKSYNTDIITTTIEHRPTIETQIMNTSELVTEENHSSKEIQTTSEIIDSINIHDETNAVENIDDENKYESIKLHFKENVIIKIPHLVEKKTLNKVVENISTNISAKSNSTEKLSLQTEIESPGLKIIYSANDVTIENDIIYKLPSLNKAKNIVNDKPNSKNIPTPNAQVSKTPAKVTIGIVTSNPQFSNTAITVLIPSKILTIKPIDFQSESDKKINEMLIYTEAETPTVIDTSTASLVCKIVVEFLKNKNKTPIEELEIIAHELIEEDTETVREITSTINSLIAVMDKQVYIKIYGSDSYYEKSDDYITNTETKTQKSIDQNNAGKYIEKESPAPISTLPGVVMENLNANIVTADAIISCTNSSTETVDVKLVTEKVVEEESPSPINYLVKLLQKNMNANKLPIESVETPKIEDISEPEITSCTKSSTANMIDVQTNKDKFIAEKCPVNSSVEEVDGKSKLNINTENETLLPIVSTKESIEGPKIEDIPENETTSCTESSTEMTDNQNHAEKIVDPKLQLLINSSDEVVGENTNLNIDTENKTLLPVESNMKSIEISKEVESINETEKIPCTNSSTETVDVKIVAEKIIEDESNSPINSLVELLQKNMNTNIETEDEILLPIESVETPKIEDITEPEITSCTKSSTANMIDVQTNKDKFIAEKCPVNSSVEEVDGKSKLNIYTENETLLPIVSTKESMEGPKIEYIPENETTSCTESSTEMTDNQNHAEKIVDPKLPLLINSSNEVVGENTNLNIDTENKTLLPVESNKKSIEISKEVEDINETEKIPCTNSSTETVDVKIVAEKIIEDESNSPINSLVELLQKNMNTNIETEDEILLPIESVETPKIEDITEPEITSCTKSSTANMIDVQTNKDKFIAEKCPVNSSVEEVDGKSKLNIYTENETLLPIVSTKESMEGPKIEYIPENETTSCTESSTEMTDNQNHAEKIVDPKLPLLINSSNEVVGENTNLNIDTENKTLLPVESNKKSIEISKEVEDINETEKIPCTNSSTETVDVKIVAEKIIEDESNSPINSLVELLQKNMNTNIETEDEILLPIESVETPKIEDIPENETTSCTESSTEMTDNQNHAEKIVDPKLQLLINSSDEVVGENTNLNIDTENKTLLPVESNMKSIEISKEVENINETEKIPCTNSSTETVDVKIVAEKIIEDESNSPINSLVELLQKNMNTNIETEDEILLPIESVETPKIEDITEPEITSCTKSSTANMIDVQTNKDKFIAEKCPVNSSVEEVDGKSKLNIYTENETLLPIVSTKESMEGPKIEYIPENETTSCTESSTEMTDNQNHAEKIVDPKLPLLINSSNEVVGENTNLNIDTENKTLLPVESNMKSIEISKEVEDINETEKIPCTNSSTETVDVKIVAEKIIEDESNSPINSLVELLQKNMNTNIETEDEILLPIESVETPKIEDITEPEITSCTKSSTEMTDNQNHAEKIVDPKLPLLINSSDEVVGENTNLNIDTENKTLLPVESNKKSIEISKEVEDINETEKIPCTNSSTETVDVKIVAEKIIEDESNSPINSLVELLQKNMNTNIETEDEILLLIESVETPKIEDITEPEITSCIKSSTANMIDVQTNKDKFIAEKCPVNSSVEEVDGKSKLNIYTENETLLPILSTKESIEGPKIEDIPEPEITSCTESSTEMTDNQNHAEKIVDPKLPLLINSSDEVVGENTNLNIDTENKTLLPVESNMKSIEISKEVEDINETEKIPCTNSSTETVNVKTVAEKIIEEESDLLINSLVELLQKNMNTNIETEDEILLPIESVETPKIEDITEPEITSSTESSKKIIQYQDHTEKMFDQEAPPVPVNFSDEGVDKRSKVAIDTETKTHLPILSILESIKNSKGVEGIIATKIPYCTESSTEYFDIQIGANNVIVKSFPTTTNDYNEILGEKTKVDLNTESEVLLPINNYVEKKKVIEEIYETLLPIESAMEFIQEPKFEENIIELKATSCTDSTPVLIQKDIEKAIEEESSIPINLLSEEVEKNINVNIDTENEIVLPIDSIIGPMEEKNEKNGLNDPLLTMKSTVESIKDPKEDEDIIITEITTCTNSLSIILETKRDVKKVIEEVPPVLINNSLKIIGEKMKVNMDIEYENILPIKATIESIEDPKVVEDIIETEITSFPESSTATAGVQTFVEGVIGEVSIVPINYSVETVGGKSKENINTEDDTLLPIESTMEYIAIPKTLEDITVTEIISCTDSCILTVDAQTDLEKGFDEVTPEKVNCSSKVVEKKTYMNIYAGNETILPIKTSTCSMKDRKAIKETTENTLPIESTMEFKKEPKLIKDTTATEIIACTDSSSVIEKTKIDVGKVIEEVPPVLINSSDKIIGEITKVNMDREYETILPIEKTDITETKIAASSTANMMDVQINKKKYMTEKFPVNSSVEEVGENTNLNIDTEYETILPIESTIETITETEILSYIGSSTDNVVVQRDIEKVIEKESPSPLNSLGELVHENMNINISTENETLLSIESIEEPKVKDITEPEIISCTESSTANMMDIQTNKEKYMAEKSEAPINSSVEEVGGNKNLNIDTEYETILPIESTIQSITETKILLCIDSSTDNLLVQTDVDKVIEEESTSSINSLGELVHENMNINISTENETLWSIKSIEEPKVEDITKPEITSYTEFSTEIIDNQYHAEKIVDVVLNNSLSEVIGENMNKEIVTVNETLLSIDSTNESILESKVEEDITVIVDVQTDIEKVIEEESPFSMKFVCELLQENTNPNINTKNEVLLQMDTHTSSVEEMKEIDEIIGIDIETENETLLSIENTSVEEQMDEVDKITQNNLLVDFSAATELNGYEIVTNKETETSTLIKTSNTTVDRQTVKEIVTKKRIAISTAFEEQKSVEPTIEIENVLSVGTSTASVEEEIQVEEVIKNKSNTLISYSTIHDVAALEEPKINKNETSTMRYSNTAMEEQTEIAAAEVVIDTYKDSLGKTMIEKDTHNETPTPIDILITVTDKQIHLDKVAENKIPILVNTSTESVEKQIKTEKVTENETITQIACETMSKIERNEFEAESENKTSTPTNNSVLIAIKQTEVENLTERTLQNDDIVYKNTKTNFIGRENKTENSDNPNNFYLKFGETSKINRFENEDNLQRKSYGIQKLEMSVQHTMKTSDEDYYEKTFVHLEQTEQISKVDNVDSENKTVIDDKLYTVNESDLNAILCASSLEEALTLLDSKIKFKFKRKKSSSKINSVEYSPKIQTSDGNSSGVNTNFTDAREFFKEIEKKSKK